MDLKQLLNMLHGVSGPNASGEYTAKCPAHEDRTASLTAREKPSGKDGKRRIYLCCHAGCQNADVMAALGITAKDLIVDPDGETWTARRAGKASGTRAGAGKASGTRSGNAKADGAFPERDSGSPAADGGSTGNAKADGAFPERDSGSPVADGGSTGKRNGSRRGSAPTDADAPPNVDPETGEIIGGLVVHQAKAAGGKSGDDGPKIDIGHPDRVYSYTDEDGKEVFQVCRYQYTDDDGKPQKTFRQRVHDPKNPKAGKAGYVYSVPADIRDTTLYRMPNVLKAIQEGRPVFVVEGEKDVETLERLGHVATCNPGGAGKWREGYSRRLAGADVIILPDNDTKGNGYTGQNHALDVALKLQQIAKRVRLVDIKEACPDLPEKGDISDMVAILGDVNAMDALARQVAATRDFDPNAVPFWLTPMEQAERLYGAVRGYGVVDGCISQITGDTSKALADFVVLPRMELEKDDGVNVSKHFVLDGWNCNGRKLGRVTIKAADMDGMNWVTEKWGFDASLTPGTATKGKVAWAIKKVGQMTAKRVTEYNHTGWRKIGGKWCYLYHGGAVGAEGITVDLGDNLRAYRLDGSGAEGFDAIPWADAARVSLRIQNAVKEEIGIALLGTVFLAPLWEFMNQTDIVPAFLLFLYGQTGTHKTTAAALALSHFGNFHAKNPPASFHDTGNQIRTKAFLMKDMPILVDDFHPATSLQEKRQMAATAQLLSRAFGDGAERGRLNADSTMSAKKPPRSVAMITGEDLPAVGASGLARYFILDIDKGDIPVGKEMTELQELARKGYLQRSMRGYILWLLNQVDEMPARLHDLFLKTREDIRKQSDGQHDRAPEAVACILIGYAMMLNYMRDLGIFDTREAGKMLMYAQEKLLGASRQQAREMESEKPTRIFLDSLAELLSSKQVALKDLTAVDAKDPPPTERMVGYMDNEYYYLLPNVAFGAVSKLCREQGQEFPVSLKALYKHLRTDGILKDIRKDGSPTKFKLINKKSVRLLWIPADALNGPRPEVKQMDMTEVGNGEIPEEWK